MKEKETSGENWIDKSITEKIFGFYFTNSIMRNDNSKLIQMKCALRKINSIADSVITKLPSIVPLHNLNKIVNCECRQKYKYLRKLPWLT